MDGTSLKITCSLQPIWPSGGYPGEGLEYLDTLATRFSLQDYLPADSSFERLWWAVRLLVASLVSLHCVKTRGICPLPPSRCHIISPISNNPGPCYGPKAHPLKATLPDSTSLGEQKDGFTPILLNSHSLSLHLLLSTGLTSNPDLPSFQRFDPEPVT